MDMGECFRRRKELVLTSDKAPVKLILQVSSRASTGPELANKIALLICLTQVTSDHLSAFEKLIEAYGKIADALPRFDRLGAALKDDHDFQAVVALMYADIIEFHRRAYRFIRRKCKWFSDVSGYADGARH